METVIGCVDERKIKPLAATPVPTHSIDSHQTRPTLCGFAISKYRLIGPTNPEFSQSRSARDDGHPAYGLDELRADLERFVFLLGGSDGEELFSP